VNIGHLILRSSPIVIFAIAPIIQTYYGRRARPRRGAYSFGRDAVRREGAILFATHVAAIIGLSGLLWLYAARPELLLWGDMPLANSWRWVGLALGVLSLVGLVEVHRQLGRQWSAFLEIQENHKLITTGMYSRVRHPMYTVLITMHVAVSLMTANTAVITFCALRVILFLVRIRREEAMLMTQFGDEYRRYMQRAGRLWPRLSAG
jgi:protein-S-isoprenylcysteine O-methyltransferase Ste14